MAAKNWRQEAASREVEMKAVVRLVGFAILLCAAHSSATADIVDNKSSQTIALPPTLGSGVDILAGAIRSDCDVIRLSAGPLRVGETLPGVSLRTGSGTWGKRVELFVDGTSRGVIEAAGNGGTSETQPIIPEELYRAQLNLLKPKAFGVMTGLYQIVGLSRFANQHIEIFWERDSC